MKSSPRASGGRSTPVCAPRGPQLNCLGWRQEGALRMLMNTLDEEVAQCPAELIVCAATAKPVRDWDCYHAVVQSLKSLESNQTLLVQSGKPEGIYETHDAAPRVLMVNSGFDPSHLKEVRRSERPGSMSACQAATENWTYIGAQGFLHTAFESLDAVARRHFEGELAGKLIVSGGMGGAGGALALAATLQGAAFLGIDADGEAIQRRIRAGYADFRVNSLDEALRILKNAVRQKQPAAVGLVGNCADILPELASRGVVPDVLTDQTSAHDLLNGYLPAGLGLEEAAALRRERPDGYCRRSSDTIARHIRGMLELRKLGAVTFEFGNSLRARAFEHAGVQQAFDFPDFAGAYLGPLLRQGYAPLEWVALSGEAKDIYRTDELVLKLFPDDARLSRWISLAQKHVKFRGLPARGAWLAPEQRELFGERLSDLVARRQAQASMLVAVNPFNCLAGSSISLASEEMKQGGTANNWPILKALLNSAMGASWLSLQNSGGRLWNAGHAAVADGTTSAAKHLPQLLKNGLTLGITNRAAADNDQTQDPTG